MGILDRFRKIVDELGVGGPKGLGFESHHFALYHLFTIICTLLQTKGEICETTLPS